MQSDFNPCNDIYISFFDSETKVHFIVKGCSPKLTCIE